MFARSAPRNADIGHSVRVYFGICLHRMSINRDYRRLWLGHTAAQFGDAVFVTAVLIWVADTVKDSPHAPAAGGAIVALSTAATLLVAPFAGVAVDRSGDKRAVMLRTDALRCTAIASVCLLSLLPRQAMPLWALGVALGLAVVLVAGAGQFFNPARFIVVGDIVPKAQYGRASSFTQGSAAVAMILGPAVAAPLTVATGVTAALAINASTFLVSYLAIRTMSLPVSRAEPTTPTERSPAARSWTAGLRTAATTPTIRAVLVTGMVVMAGAGAVTALNVFFVQENLGADPAWYGYVSSGMGAGLLLGAVAAGFVGDRVGHPRVLRFALAGCALAFAVYSRMDDAWSAVLVIGLYGVFAGAVETVVTPLLLADTPRAFLGRVSAVFVPAMRVASMLSAAAAGVIAGGLPAGFSVSILGLDFGRIDAVYAASALLLALGALYASFAFRSRNRHPDRVTAVRDE